jgi:hypothetical protein
MRSHVRLVIRLFENMTRIKTLQVRTNQRAGRGLNKAIELTSPVEKGLNINAIELARPGEKGLNTVFDESMTLSPDDLNSGVTQASVKLEYTTSHFTLLLSSSLDDHT